MQITPDGTAQYPNAASDLTPITSDVEYVLTAWTRCAVARDVDLNLNWFGPEAEHAVRAGQWRFFEVRGHAPADTAAMNAAPAIPDTPPTGATVFPVDLSVGGERVRASSAQPWTWDDFTRPATPASWG
ncbi:hypothetical protein, partial [Streptomyces boncukensis]